MELKFSTWVSGSSTFCVIVLLLHKVHGLSIVLSEGSRTIRASPAVLNVTFTAVKQRGCLFAVKQYSMYNDHCKRKADSGN